VLAAGLGALSCRSESGEKTGRTHEAAGGVPEPAARPDAGVPEPAITPGATSPGPAGLTEEQRLRAERLINNFEHGTTEFQYGSAEALPDGRGITFGRAGFTTQSGDGRDVVARYAAAKPDNPLAKYLPRLDVLARGESGSTEGLDGFIEAVRRVAGDPNFRRAQDEVQEELYYRPSSRFCDAVGLKMALSRAAIYDSLLMHGAGDDPDGLPALLERTRNEVGGTPASGVDEVAWLSAFLRIRRDDLAHARKSETRAVWARSVGRVDVFRTLADQGNTDLHGPIVLGGEYAGMIP
jgi:chitosanase